VSSPVALARAHCRSDRGSRVRRRRISARLRCFVQPPTGTKSAPGVVCAEGRCFLSDGLSSLCAWFYSRYASLTARPDGPQILPSTGRAGSDRQWRVDGNGQRLMTAYDTLVSICFPLRLTTWSLRSHNDRDILNIMTTCLCLSSS